MNSIIKTQAGLIRELLDSTQDIGIILGESQGVDSVAAGLSLYLVLTQDGKNVQIVSKKEPMVEVSNLVGVNKIAKSFEGNTKILTISVPYREGEIEKVSYNIEGTKLNVNLFAEENGISFSERDVEYIKKGSSPSLIITVGVSTEAELDDLVDPSGVKTIHIDRNPVNPLLGDVALIDPAFSSLSEIVATLIRELSLPFDVDAFQNLMDGITYATRNFTLPATSAFAFEAAGFLLQNGARRKEKSADRETERSSDRSSDRFGRAQGAQDRPRNFPREDQFLNQKPRFQTPPPPASASRQNSNPLSRVQMPTSSPQPQQPRSMPQNSPFGGQNDDDVFNQPNINKASGETENAMPEDVPDDWFLPKVFKGSKKGN